MKTVLLVDDEPHLLKIYADGLAPYAAEFQLVTAPNGLVASQLVETRAVDLVVTDIMMPAMDGFELLAYLRRHHTAIPVIVMTAVGSPEMEAAARQLRTFAYLEKPIYLKDLLASIRRALAEPEKGFL